MVLKTSRLARKLYISAVSTARPLTTSAHGSVHKAREHCLNILRRNDVPSFLLKGYVPRHGQDAFLALHALNVDVARVADSTSHPSIGAMRMQFWRDAVDRALAGSPPEEPVAILLSAAAEDLHIRSKGKSRLSKRWLHRIIDTREQYLGNKPYPTLDALESYAENTYSTLLYLSLSALSINSVTADHLASHIGKATGIAAVLRGFPLVAFPQVPSHHSSNARGGPIGSPPQGAVLLPLDVMAQTGLQEEQVFRQGGNAPNLQDALFTVATRANDHLITASEMLKNLQEGRDVGHDFEHAHEDDHRSSDGLKPNIEGLGSVDPAFGVLLRAVVTHNWLERLQKVDFDVFNRTLMQTDWKLPWKLAWSSYRKQI
ncbi:hypothetical protein BT63DRAFT_325513 [Microthyrium microscopicum]|uniref:Squalene/phytoene synthase n=1 Tax=Microthyrium microscopicum TaxID=703497 RepID=A0A6A6U497_9PEZI|nr:hypothetical protein BT63DRAFT_325513 [Microthyrium microscopicum]